MVSQRKISYLLFFAILLSLISGFFPQLQMLFFNGRILIPTISIKLLIILLVISGLFFSLKREVTFFFIGSTFLFYLLIEAFYFINVKQLPISYVIFGYNYYYFYLLIIPFVALLRKDLSDKFLYKVVIIISIPLSIIGITQFLLNNPILPTGSIDGAFSVNSWSYKFTNTRAFSLFDSALNFGHFLCLAVSFVWAKVVIRNFKFDLSKTFLIFLLSITIYMTLTRNIYIEYISIIINIVLLRFFYKKKLLKLLPIANYIIGVIINNYAPLIASLFVKNNIFDLNTYYIRQNEWLKVKDMWFDNGFLNLLFGTGLIQNQKYAISKDLIVDNVFLSIGIHIGIIGLFLWLVIMWIFWIYCFNITREKFNYFNLGILAFFSSWPLTGTFNNNLYIYPLVFLFYIMVNNDELNWKKRMHVRSYKLQ